MRRIVAIALMSLLLAGGSPAVLEAATCYGSDPCNACKNCKYCKHCAKDGGSCGICKIRR
jgi:hypothetical protein